jgi:hypothetical protein
MSDEGKVLLGTDGNPLTSADGKIVLAGLLLPTTIQSTCTISNWYRDHLETQTTSDIDIWAQSWQSGSQDPYRTLRLTPSGEQATAQLWRKIVIDDAFVHGLHEGLDIAVDRIANVYLRVNVDRISNTGDDGEFVPFRLYYTTSGSDPAGSEEPWESAGWNEVSLNSDVDIGSDGNQTVNLELPLSALSGITVMIALFADVYTPGGSPVAFERFRRLKQEFSGDGGFYFSETGSGDDIACRIKYNLAT